jgi:hypothetical protein
MGREVARDGPGVHVHEAKVWAAGYLEKVVGGLDARDMWESLEC